MASRGKRMRCAQILKYLILSPFCNILEILFSQNVLSRVKTMRMLLCVFNRISKRICFYTPTVVYWNIICLAKAFYGDIFSPNSVGWRCSGTSTLGPQLSCQPALSLLDPPLSTSCTSVLCYFCLCLVPSSPSPQNHGYSFLKVAPLDFLI